MSTEQVTHMDDATARKVLKIALRIVGDTRACSVCRNSIQCVESNRVRFGVHHYSDFDGHEWICDEHHAAGKNFYSDYNGEDPVMRRLVNALGPNAVVDVTVGR